jgi:hypothetical protein
LRQGKKNRGEGPIFFYAVLELRADLSDLLDHLMEVVASILPEPTGEFEHLLECPINALGENVFVLSRA